jgi:hypothetical protein
MRSATPPLAGQKRNKSLHLLHDMPTGAYLTHRVAGDGYLESARPAALLSRRPGRDRGQERGIRQLLDENWRKVYRANAPRGLFSREEMQAA